MSLKRYWNSYFKFFISSLTSTNSWLFAKVFLMLSSISCISSLRRSKSAVTCLLSTFICSCKGSMACCAKVPDGTAHNTTSTKQQLRRTIEFAYNGIAIVSSQQRYAKDCCVLHDRGAFITSCRLHHACVQTAGVHCWTQQTNAGCSCWPPAMLFLHWKDT